MDARLVASRNVNREHGVEMKFVRIEHERCDEWNGYTYAFAPDEWSEDDIDNAVQRAQKSYLEQVRAAKEGVPKPHYEPAVTFYERHPDLTIREAKAKYAEKAKELADWQARARQQTTSFETFLTREGFIPLGDADAVDIDLDWGHRHGTRLNYGNDDQTNSLPLPVQMAGKKDEDELWP